MPAPQSMLRLQAHNLSASSPSVSRAERPVQSQLLVIKQLRDDG
jgi:hypothetical protein